MAKAIHTLLFSAAAIGLVGALLPSSASALEVNLLPQVTPQVPTCGNVAYHPPLKTFQHPACLKCQGAVNTEAQQANGILGAAKGFDMSTIAGATGLTSLFSAATTATQNSPQDTTSGLNAGAGSGAEAQAGAAQKVSAAMKQCAQKIRAECSAGLAPEDKAAADATAASCESTGAQADATSADKMSKMAEMLKNAGQAAQQAMGMGQEKGSGDKAADTGGLSSNYNPYQPSISSGLDTKNTTTPDVAALDKTPNNSPTADLGNNTTKSGGSSILTNDTGQKADGSELSYSRSPASAGAGGASGSEKAGAFHAGGAGSGSADGGASMNTPSTTASGGSSGSSSSGGSGGASDSSAASKLAAEQAAAAAAAQAAAGEGDGSYGSGGGGGGYGGSGGLRSSTLGLRSTGDELNDLVANKDQLAKNSNGEGDLANMENKSSLGEPASPGEDENLFFRVKRKLSYLSRARHMQ